jgi:hypothetical protein
MKVWAADRPEEDSKADQGADGDVLPKEDAGTSDVRAKSASSHPLRNWNDDDDEVMVLGLLDVVPMGVAPPQATLVAWWWIRVLEGGGD